MQTIAQKEGDAYVGLEPLLMALLEVKSTASQMMKDAGLTSRCDSQRRHQGIARRTKGHIAKSS